MKKIELYQCEVCGTQYKFSQDCEKCEKFHTNPENITSARWRPFNEQGADKYPVKVFIKMFDGKTIEYKR